MNNGKLALAACIVLAALVLAGCEKNLLEDVPDAAPPPDAEPPPDAIQSCPTPAQPLAAGRYKVYLNTEGVTLAKGGCDDSRTNCTSLVTIDQTVVPPFLPGDPDRQTFIDQIVATAQGVLAPYSIDIVTTRPTTTDYEMIVMGGDGQAIAGCSDCGSTDAVSCTTFANRDHVDLIFDFGSNPPFTTFNYASKVLGNLGNLVGLVPSAQVDDCLCFFDAPCQAGQSTTRACTYGTMVPTTMVASSNCGITPTEDEPAILAAALGCR